MSIVLKLSGIGLLFTIAIATGFWLHFLGRPLHAVIFTIHKLTALAAVIFTAIVIFTLLKGIKPAIAIPILIIAGALSVIMLFVSGALLSNENKSNSIMFIIHNIATITAVISVSLLSFQLGRL